MQKKQTYDLVIVGAGMVGLALAAALRPLPISIAIVDRVVPASPDDWEGFDLRVSSLTRASENFLNNIGVWQTIREKGVCPFDKMDVWEQDGTASIQFSAADMGEHCLGHIVENRITQRSLYEHLTSAEDSESASDIYWFCPASIEDISEGKNERAQTVWEVQLVSGEVLSTTLLVGADGANSFVKEKIGFEQNVESLGHSAIVTSIETEKEHESVARQRFLQSGPLALLPLRNKAFSDNSKQEKHCSIVWSMAPERAEKMMALDDDAFLESLSEQTEYRLGQIVSCDKRVSFPLVQRHAKSYVGSGVVLIGDAAHTIHPLAGQGVNLGFMDAAVLAEEVQRALKREVPIHAKEVLRRYERRRRGQNTMMMKLMTGFRDLFAANNADVRGIRNLGIKLTNELPFVKQHIVSRAMGLDGDIPKLARQQWF